MRMMKDPNALACCCCKKKEDEDLILEFPAAGVVQHQPQKRDSMMVDEGPEATADGAQQQLRGQKHAW